MSTFQYHKNRNNVLRIFYGWIKEGNQQDGIRYIRQDSDRDDDPDNLHELIEFFNSSGFDTVGATGREKRHHKSREFSPDVILLDVRMPAWDGYEPAAGSRIRISPRTFRDIRHWLIRDDEQDEGFLRPEA